MGHSDLLVTHDSPFYQSLRGYDTRSVCRLRRLRSMTHNWTLDWPENPLPCDHPGFETCWVYTAALLAIGTCHEKIANVWPNSLLGVPDILARHSCVHYTPRVTRQLALTLSTRPSPIESVRLPIATL